MMANFYLSEVAKKPGCMTYGSSVAASALLVGAALRFCLIQSLYKYLCSSLLLSLCSLKLSLPFSHRSSSLYSICFLKSSLFGGSG